MTARNVAILLLGSVIGAAGSLGVRQWTLHRKTEIREEAMRAAEADSIAKKFSDVAPQYRPAEFQVRSRRDLSELFNIIVIGETRRRLAPPDELALISDRSGAMATVRTNALWTDFERQLWELERETLIAERAAAVAEDEAFKSRRTAGAVARDVVAFTVTHDGELIEVRRGEVPELDAALVRLREVYARRDAALHDFESQLKADR